MGFGANGKTVITRRLSGIHAAWHFWYAVSFSGESGLRKVGLGGTHPLTLRYVLGKEIRFGDGKN
ncbi:DUF3265 domain-containing protein [Vibrio vulnificus]|nr:DUF3265 domain-containing protein [Vibrio vulnificus]EIA1338489.1 DUF3265 domain-containing protein [Vibrio vulnificus]EIA1774665.1 DUF3265 domain-containing protein [Vibrio vulnificus]EIU7597634.1 DUF3265 domain-containing protein [Vibrio vulnificus]EIX4871636.1 DUF3265 domain-containing protein [Vibrio vulnificus]